MFSVRVSEIDKHLLLTSLTLIFLLFISLPLVSIYCLPFLLLNF